jgi:crotonobetainyl-CoA:carnitine CoA-transferase CaiB-like acyl-CoA transferase
MRVIELVGRGSGIAGAHAGWLLARMGAQVTRLLLPSARSSSPAQQDADPIVLTLEALAQGKAAEPAPVDAPGLDARLAGVDVLLCDDPAAFGELDTTPAALLARLPGLVIGVGSTFGLDDTGTALPGTGIDAQALSGVAWVLGEPGRAPLTLPAGILEHPAGAMLAAGCVLALGVRETRGSGRIVDVALTDVLASFVAGNCRFYVHHGLRWHRSGRRASGSGGAYPFVILPCRDGDVCITGRTRAEWERLVRAMGSPEWASQRRYQSLRAMGREYPEEVDALLRPWLAQHTMAELERIAFENNLIVSPIRGFDDVLRTRHFSADGFLESVPLGGRTMRSPALPFRASETRAASAPDIASRLLADAPASTKSEAAPPGQPLAGLRILDLGWVWSAPWVSTILCELGAQVIKVEHAGKPDNLRLSGTVIRDGQPVPGPSTEISPMYHQVNHGKLGITLNTKHPAAIALLRRLAAMSDAVIENMSPGTLDRQGLGWQALQADNPRLVMLSMSGMGQFGELASMRAYAPTMSSFAGLEALVGYPGEAPIGALNFALADPNASVHALLPLLAALRRARATGRGCYIDFSQIEALLGTLRPYLLDAQATGRQPAPRGNAHPSMCPHGIYPARGDDAWVSIAIADDDRWQALCRIARDADWSDDPGLAQAADRRTRSAELDAALAAWTARHERDALVATLRTAGIACSPVLSRDEAWSSRHFADRGLMHRVTLPHYGPEPLFRAPWRFSDLTPRIDRCGPSLGEHNTQVFGDLLGLPEGEIAELVAAGVIA